jgi:hypothetical protein
LLSQALKIELFLCHSIAVFFVEDRMVKLLAELPFGTEKKALKEASD